MEQHQAKPTPRRTTRRKSSAKQPNLWQRSKTFVATARTKWPIWFNLLIVVAIFFGVLGLCSVAMNIFTRHGERLAVPNYLGVNVHEAASSAKAHELEIIISDSLYIPGYEGGIIVDQIPRGGAVVKRGRKVYVTINSFTQRMVRVPYVAGRSLRQAKNMLDIVGLGIEKLVYEPDLATNYVLAEVVNGVTMKSTSEIDIPVGSGVVLKVGVNHDSNKTIVPKTVGCSLREARSRLWEQGLNVGKVVFDDGINKLSEKDARVYQQSLGHNAETTLGRSVDIYLTLDMNKVGESSAASDKAAKKIEEERLESEQESRNVISFDDESDVVILESLAESVDVASSDDAIVSALQQSSSSEEFLESEEDEFF